MVRGTESGGDKMTQWQKEVLQLLQEIKAAIEELVRIHKELLAESKNTTKKAEVEA